MLLVFSYEHSKPKAFAPIPFLVAIGVGMAAESLVTMGVKAVSKNVLKKQALSYSDELAAKGQFDWAGLNPYRNKDGSITLSPSANDRAKLAGLVSGGLLGSMVGEDMNGVPYDAAGGQNKMACPSPSDLSEFERVQLKLSSGITPDRADYQKYISETGNTNALFSFYKHTDSAGLTRVRVKYNLTNTVIYSNSRYLSSADGPFTATIYSAHDNYFDFVMKYGSNTLASNDMLMDKTVMNDPYYQSMLKAAAAEYQLYYCDGLIIPESLERVYPAPMDMSTTYIMPNNSQLKDIDFTINNIYPPGQTEGYVTWEELEKYFDDNNLNIDDVIDSNMDNYLENGDINYNEITIEEIENVYTDINQDEKIEDFDPPRGELPVPVPDPGDIVPVDPVDRSLLQIAKESYQYLADTVKSSVDGLTAVTAGATGIITFLGTTMGWLPDEWIVMFSAAFGLGLFAFFFRR